MTDCGGHVPDIAKYQQLHSGDPHGGVNCTAYMGAILTDAHTCGKTLITGRQVRAASNEPVPDPHSPGLNLPQVDNAVFKLTKGAVNLDTHLGFATAAAQPRIEAGQWAGLQVRRSVLVGHGLGGGNGFGGGHAITVHAIDGLPVIGDPLVPHYQTTTWATIWQAAAALVIGPGETVGKGQANITFTRDVTADYVFALHPAPGHRKAFYVYHVNNGEIVSRRLDSTGGFSATCTPPRWHDWPGHVGRSLVELTSGSRKGKVVESRWSHEA